MLIVVNLDSITNDTLLNLWVWVEVDKCTSWDQSLGLGCGENPIELLWILFDCFLHVM